MTEPDPAHQRDEGGFRRVHPLSPFVRGGLIALAVLGYVVSQQVERLSGAVSAPPSGGEGAPPLLLQAAGVAAVILGAVLIGLLSWWFSRYRLGEESLEMRSGALFRQHRQVRYDRIQAVDLVRPLLARLLGLSEVRVESAGGGDSHVSIAYLRTGEAEAVRTRLLGLAARARHPDTPAGPGEPDTVAGPTDPADERADEVEPVLSVPAGRLVGSVLLSEDAVFFAVFVVIATVLTLVDLGVVVGGILPAVLIAGGRGLLRLTRWYGAAVGRREGTLTIQRGLTDTRSSTVPLHRVQAIEVTQPLLWRRPGWWVVKVNVAGAHFGSSESGDSDDVLVPVVTTQEAVGLVDVVLGERSTTGEVAALLRGTPEDFIGQPPRARRLDPFAHRRIGCVLGTWGLLTRGGWLGRWVQVVPYGRIQSITVGQGPLERRLGLADLRLISTVGPVRPRVSHLAEADAEHLGVVTADLAGRARRGRAGGAGCDPAPKTVDWPVMNEQTRGRTAVGTGESTSGNGLAEVAVEKLGFSAGQVVQEYGWDDDVDEALRAAVEDVAGVELEDEDYTGVVDAVIMWWRDGDGDLTDALVDTLGTLAEGSSIVLVTPRPGQDEEVDPSDVDEAATTAGLHTSGSVMCSPRWVATRLAARRGPR